MTYSLTYIFKSLTFQTFSKDPEFYNCNRIITYYIFSTVTGILCWMVFFWGLGRNFDPDEYVEELEIAAFFAPIYSVFNLVFIAVLSLIIRMLNKSLRYSDIYKLTLYSMVGSCITGSVGLLVMMEMGSAIWINGFSKCCKRADFNDFVIVSLLLFSLFTDIFCKLTRNIKKANQE